MSEQESVIVSMSAEKVLENAGITVEDAIVAMGLDPGARLTVAAARKYVDEVADPQPDPDLEDPQDLEAVETTEPEPEPALIPADPQLVADLVVDWQCPNPPDRIAEAICFAVAGRDIREVTVTAWRRVTADVCEFLAEGHKGPIRARLLSPFNPPQGPPAGILGAPKEAKP